MKNVIETVGEFGAFDVLSRVVAMAEIQELLNDEDHTLFAPSDTAFAKLQADMMDDLFGDHTRISQILRHHIIPGRFSVAQLISLGEVTPLEGEALKIAAIPEGGVTVSGAPIARADVECANGTIHIIDTVLLLPA